MMKDEENKRMIRKGLGPAPVIRLPQAEQKQREKTFRIMVRRGPPRSDMTQEEWESECHRRVFGEE
jgi:ribosomal protein S10